MHSLLKKVDVILINTYASPLPFVPFVADVNVETTHNSLIAVRLKIM